MSSTHAKSTWIKEWATQVVEHNHHGNIEVQQLPNKAISKWISEIKKEIEKNKYLFFT